MENEISVFRDDWKKKYTEDIRSMNEIKKNILVISGIFLLLFLITVVFSGCSLFGKSDYEKGTSFLKDKKFTEALYEFQKVDPDNKNFSNAQSKINYINGLLSFNDGKKPEAIVFLSKVKSDDEYYHDAQLMLQKINEASIGNDLQSQIDELKNNKDTVIIRKEVSGIPKKNKEPIDPVVKADQEISRKYVSDAGSIISRFEGFYQSARTAPLTTKSDYGKNLEAVNKEFNVLKYSAQNKDAGVNELKRLASEYMNKRIAFIHMLISEKSVNETTTSRPLKDEGDRLYTELMNQMSKVRKSL